MPTLGIYIAAQDWRSLEDDGLDPSEWIRDFVKRGLADRVREDTKIDVAAQDWPLSAATEQLIDREAASAPEWEEPEKEEGATDGDR